MTTRNLFYEDPYLKEASAKIIEISDQGILLDQTIFFGKSCGVKPDTGTISNEKGIANVVNVLRSDKGNIHVIDENPGFGVGDEVNLKIDWDRRYAMMKHHTTLHLISAIVWNKHGVLVTGSDITPEKAKIDFDMSRNFTKEELKEIEDQMRKIIEEDHPTSAEVLSIDEVVSTPGLIRTKNNILPKGLKEVRVVSIGSVDRQADGGIHVKSTKELGSFKILKHKNKGRGIRRLEVTVF